MQGWVAVAGQHPQPRFFRNPQEEDVTPRAEAVAVIEGSGSSASSPLNMNQLSQAKAEYPYERISRRAVSQVVVTETLLFLTR
jgi:hypothetical protein